MGPGDCTLLSAHLFERCNRTCAKADVGESRRSMKLAWNARSPVDPITASPGEGTRDDEISIELRHTLSPELYPTALRGTTAAVAVLGEGIAPAA